MRIGYSAATFSASSCASRLPGRRSSHRETTDQPSSVPTADAVWKRACGIQRGLKTWVRLRSATAWPMPLPRTAAVRSRRPTVALAIVPSGASASGCRASVRWDHLVAAQARACRPTPPPSPNGGRAVRAASSAVATLGRRPDEVLPGSCGRGTPPVQVLGAPGAAVPQPDRGLPLLDQGGQVALSCGAGDAEGVGDVGRGEGVVRGPQPLGDQPRGPRGLALGRGRPRCLPERGESAVDTLLAELAGRGG